MRSVVGMVGALLLALAALSCDTTQPLLLDQQTFELQILATGVQTTIFNVYDGFEDANGDGQADDTNGDGQPDFFLHCLTRTQDPTTSAPSSVPWGYTVSITILRAGETEPETITSTDAASDPSFSVAEYDTTASTLGVVPPAPAPVTVMGRMFRFTNGRILSQARRDVLSQTTSPLVELDPGTYGTVGQGRCSTFYPGPTLVDSATSSAYPRTIMLRKGDTVTITAALSTTPPPGIPVLNPPAPSLASTFTLHGAGLDVRGSTTESTPGGGFRFSYSTR
jgi:hypothetical protein